MYHKTLTVPHMNRFPRVFRALEHAYPSNTHLILCPASLRDTEWTQTSHKADIQTPKHINLYYIPSHIHEKITYQAKIAKHTPMYYVTIASHHPDIPDQHIFLTGPEQKVTSLLQQCSTHSPYYPKRNNEKRLYSLAFTLPSQHHLHLTSPSEALSIFDMRRFISATQNHLIFPRDSFHIDMQPKHYRQNYNLNDLKHLIFDYHNKTCPMPSHHYLPRNFCISSSQTLQDRHRDLVAQYHSALPVPETVMLDNHHAFIVPIPLLQDNTLFEATHLINSPEKIIELLNHYI